MAATGLPFNTVDCNRPLTALVPTRNCCPRARLSRQTSWRCSASWTFDFATNGKIFGVVFATYDTGRRWAAGTGLPTADKCGRIGDRQEVVTTE